VKSYNANIANNPKAELILLSRDRSEDAATAWAKKENMPWPTLMKEDTDSTFLKPYGLRYLPTYILVDRNGKKIATGKEAAFAKIKKTTQ